MESKQNIKIFDKSFNIDSNYDLNKVKSFFEWTNKSDFKMYLREKRGNSYFEDNNEIFLTYPEEVVNIHYLRQVLGGIAGKYSEDYNLIHASGLILENKGIVFTGNRGSGKSTLVKLFPEDKIMDDDILGVTRSDIHLVGKMGSISYVYSGKKRLKYLISEPVAKKHSIDYIFMLDKRMDGGKVEELSPFIDRKYSNLNTLPKVLQKDYLSKSPIAVQGKVYLLGTGNKIFKTQKTIEKIIQNH